MAPVNAHRSLITTIIHLHIADTYRRLFRTPRPGLSDDAAQKRAVGK